jgi:hypothetical protein
MRYDLPERVSKNRQPNSALDKARQNEDPSEAFLKAHKECALRLMTRDPVRSFQDLSVLRDALLATPGHENHPKV